MARASSEFLALKARKQDKKWLNSCDFTPAPAGDDGACDRAAAIIMTAVAPPSRIMNRRRSILAAVAALTGLSRR